MSKQIPSTPSFTTFTKEAFTITPKLIYLQQTTQTHTISTTPELNTPTKTSLVIFPNLAPDPLIIRLSPSDDFSTAFHPTISDNKKTI
jgi:hypothetical protein